MADVYTTSSGTRNPKIWLPDLLDGLYEAASIGRKTLRKFVGEGVEKTSIGIEPVISSLSNIDNDTGEIDASAMTISEVEINLDKFRGKKIIYSDKTKTQSKDDLSKIFAKAFGKAVAEDIDTSLFGLYGSVTTNSVGSSSDSVNEDLLVAAISKLLNQKVPIRDAENMGLFLHSFEYPAVKKAIGLSYSYATGEDKGAAGASLPENLYGIPVFFSSLIPANSGSRKNIVMHRNTMAYAMQKEPEIKIEGKNGAWATVCLGKVLYGVKIGKEEMGCLILTDDQI